MIAIGTGSLSRVLAPRFEAPRRFRASAQSSFRANFLARRICFRRANGIERLPRDVHVRGYAEISRAVRAVTDENCQSDRMTRRKNVSHFVKRVERSDGLSAPRVSLFSLYGAA